MENYLAQQREITWPSSLELRDPAAGNFVASSDKLRGPAADNYVTQEREITWSTSGELHDPAEGNNVAQQWEITLPSGG